MIANTIALVEVRIMSIVEDVHGDSDDFEKLANLLADLRHWAEARSIDWEEAEYRSSLFQTRDLNAEAIHED